ncbi:hypothetical protein DXB96_14950 [Clostridium sp. OM07-10AC]|jgi:hypothetical protein|nr:hypothetical protein DXC08_14445 [Clostridium sp. OM07-9AC]RHU99753.1 hypothetical protein DXB96_14950 [Clostridium sp. OM07-10AC]
MKKSTIFIASCGVALLVAITGGLFVKNTKSESLYDDAGKQLEEYVNTKDNSAVATGKNIKVTFAELQLRGKVQKYLGDEEDYDAILNDLIEEKVLYYNAAQAGIKEDEADARQQVDDMKKMVEEGASGAEQVKSILAQFDDENDYWDYVKERIMIKGMIQEYKETLEKKADDKGSKKSVAQEIKNMVSEQNVNINSELFDKAKASEN